MDRDEYFRILEEASCYNIEIVNIDSIREELKIEVRRNL